MSNEASFKVGDRVWCAEQQIWGKVVRIAADQDGLVYVVREFEHPHRIVRVYPSDLERPTWSTHDEKKARE